MKKVDFTVTKVLLRKFWYLARKLLVKKSCKYFISYLRNDYKVKPLHIILPEMNAYAKSYDGCVINGCIF